MLYRNFFWLMGLIFAVINTVWANPTASIKALSSTQNFSAKKANAAITLAKLSIIDEPVANVSTDKNTLFSLLLKEEGRTKEQMLELNRSMIKFYTIEYEIPSSYPQHIKKPILQYGLFRALDPKLQAIFERSKSPITVKIRYQLENPVSFLFIIDGQEFDHSVMLSQYLNE